MSGQQDITKSKIFESAVYLEFKLKNKIDFGTGVIIEDITPEGTYAYIVTAKHVIGKTDTSGIFKVKDSTLFISYYGDINSEKRNTVSINIQNMYDYNLIRYSEDKDVAVILLAKIIDSKFQFEPTANITEVEVYKEARWSVIYTKQYSSFDNTILGMDSYLIGYPKTIGLKQSPQFDYNKPLLRKGVVAGKYRDKETFVIDGAAFGGNSGGPVYSHDSNGNIILIGIVSQYIPYVSNHGVNNSNYSVAVSTEVIERILGTFREK